MSIDAFVNSNKPNVHFTITDTDPHYMFEVFPERFAKMVKHTRVNDDADPVLVFERKGVFVAWYDMENAHGYIA